ncbi:abortive infection system antitoxin AbiGi family protein [Flavobacterium silvaticum]|uniref:Uncharacterized protein n=1 Tax=Flavobacterium silvaticum TaxID=1852020 RepID=A0A972JE44_9FLAO|nr:abortive infection system antitoxin AbiGi family protein [Flavobacterium silvaticum]NMH26459.1 hypothetical protein [Flavobacterium silvaticum]
MAISANTIIHYTEKIDTIFSIIEEGRFKLSYCLEKTNTRGGQKFSFAIAMVSFCDIPISDYKKHFKPVKGKNLGYYGDYGIGLSKKWAKKNGLNPVIYIDTNSFAGTALRRSIEMFVKDNRIIHIESFFEEEITQFACYSKNYQGDLYRKGKLEQKDYKFYDEREWRFVPQQKSLSGQFVMLDEENYLSDRENLQNQLGQNGLDFTLEDIFYIIVKDESEIQSLVDTLSKKYNSLDQKNQLQILLTKIITSEQIISDF